MIELLNIFNSIADSNLAYYLLIIILLIVVVAMIYLIYSQNKEINEAKKSRDLEENKEVKEEVVETSNKEEKTDMVSDLVKDMEKDEAIDRTNSMPIHDSVLEMINKDEDLSNTVKNIALAPEEKPVEEEKVVGDRVKKVEDIELPRVKKMELIDATLTNLPKISLLEETMTAIPPILDFSDETKELYNITKELEQVPKEKTIKLTPYEEEQEEKAIISYDELINNKDNIVYENEVHDGDVSIKQVDLDKTIEMEAINETPRETYAHEELFLKRLKSLQNKIN